jgi:hypothetical protein
MVKAKDKPQLLTSKELSLVVPTASATARLSHDNLIRFMPCGYVPSFIDDIGVWVKLKASKDHTNSVITHFQTNREWFVEYPDRLLYMSRHNHKNDSSRPLDLKWDKFISLSLMSSNGSDYHFDRFMINPHAMTQKDKKANYATKKINRTGLLICSDSGGFQLRSGLSTWIDPYEVINFYNANVDEGMPLDLPCGYAPEETFKACAEVQVLNSRIFKENKRPNLRLGTIIHGISVNEMRMYKRIIDDSDPEWDFCALPSSMSLPALKQLDRLCFLLSNGYQYPHYHQLGMYSLASTVLTARLAQNLLKANRRVLFTADASTAIYMAKMRGILTRTTQYNSVERFLLGKNSIAGGTPNHSKKVHCSCSMCQNLGYLDAYTQWEGSPPKYLLDRHNSIVFSEWCNMMNDYARDLDDKQYLELISSIITGRQKQQVIFGMEYLKVLFNDGWQAAHRRFSHQINTMFPIENMFNDNPVQVTSEKRDITNERLKNLAKKYLSWHKKGANSPLKKRVERATERYRN